MSEIPLPPDTTTPDGEPISDDTLRAILIIAGTDGRSARARRGADRRDAVAVDAGPARAASLAVPRPSVLATHPARDRIIAAVRGGRSVNGIAHEYGVTESSIRRYIAALGITSVDETTRLAAMFRDLHLETAYDLLPRWRTYSLAERLALVQSCLLMMLQRALETGAPHVVLQSANALNRSSETEVKFRGTQTPDESLADAERGQSVMLQRLVARLRERPELAEELLHDLSTDTGVEPDGVVPGDDGTRADPGAEADADGAEAESLDAVFASEREDVDGVDGGGGRPDARGAGRARGPPHARAASGARVGAADDGDVAAGGRVDRG